MTIDDTLKIVQICFYVVGAALGALTYISAKRGLLNTVNTEYHKRVIERLKELADELVSEFDPESPNYWAGKTTVRELVSTINEEFRAAEKAGRPIDFFGIPVGKEEAKLETFIRRVKADPFIPREVRRVILESLQSRSKAISEVFVKQLESYQEALKAGKHHATLEDNHGWIHNQIIGDLYARGHGVSQVEEQVDHILGSIQNYFETFSPTRRTVLVPNLTKRLKRSS